MGNSVATWRERIDSTRHGGEEAGVRAKPLRDRESRGWRGEGQRRGPECRGEHCLWRYRCEHCLRLRPPPSEGYHLLTVRSSRNSDTLRQPAATTDVAMLWWLVARVFMHG